MFFINKEQIKNLVGIKRLYFCFSYLEGIEQTLRQKNKGDNLKQPQK